MIWLMPTNLKDSVDKVWIVIPVLQMAKSIQKKSASPQQVVPE